jgi:hypothetical protein
MRTQRRRTALAVALGVLGSAVAVVATTPAGAVVAGPPIERLQRLGNVDVNAVALDGSDRELLAVREPDRVQLRDGGRAVWTTPLSGQINVGDAAFLPDGSVVIVGGYVDQDPAQIGEGDDALVLPFFNPPGFPSYNTAFVARLDADGVPQWARILRGHPDTHLIHENVVTDPDGNIYVGGGLGSGDGEDNAGVFDPGGAELQITGHDFVVSYGPDGTRRWVTHADGPHETFPDGVELAITDDGTGLVGVSPFTDLAEWTSAAGPLTLDPPVDTRSFAVLHLDTADGAIEWAATATARSVLFGHVAVDDDGNAYLAGQFSRSDELSITGTSGPLGLGGSANQNVDNGFVARLDPAGVAEWATGFRGDLWVSDVQVDDDDRVLVTGTLRGGPVTFGTLGNRSVLWPRATSEPYLAGLGLDGVHQFAQRFPLANAFPILGEGSDRVVLSTLVDDPAMLSVNGRQRRVAVDGPDSILLDLGDPGTTPLPPRPPRAQVTAATGYVDELPLNAEDVAFDDDGAVLVAGGPGWLGRLGDDVEPADRVVTALEPSGDTRWTTRLSGSIPSPFSVAWGEDGDAYLAGTVVGTLQIGEAAPIGAADETSWYLVHLDASGQPTWVRRSTSQFPTSWELGPDSLAVRPGGTAVLALGLHGGGSVDDGQGGSTPVPLPRGSAAVVLGYDEDGVLTDVDASLRASTDVGPPRIGIAQDGSLGLTAGFAGRLTHGARPLGADVPHGVLAARYDSDQPDLRWARMIAQGRQVSPSGTAVAPDLSTYVAILSGRGALLPRPGQPARSIGPGVVLVKLDPLGRPVWSRLLRNRTAGGALSGGAVVVPQRGGVIVGLTVTGSVQAETSATVTTSSAGGSDPVVFSYDRRGRLRGRFVDGGPHGESLAGLDVRDDGGLTALLHFDLEGVVGADDPSEQRFLSGGGSRQAILVDYPTSTFLP